MIDEKIGQVVEKLKEKGLYDDAVIEGYLSPPVLSRPGK